MEQLGLQTDYSQVRARELVQQPLQGLPRSEELSAVLFQRPVAKLPVFPDVLAGLHAYPDLASMCELNDGRNTFLAQRISAAMTARLHPGGEHMTGHLVNNFLVDLLVDELDQGLPWQQELGLTVYRDEGDDDSTITGASDKGRSLRPDCQLRIQDDALLFKWEERAAGVPFRDSLDDLNSQYLQPKRSTSWCPVSPLRRW